MFTAGPAHASRWQVVIGWVGVGFLTVIAGFFALFAFGEVPAQGLGGFLGHALQAVLVMGFGFLSVARPKVGAGALFLAAVAVLVLEQLLPITVPLLITALLLWFGDPQPRRLAYWLIALGPALVGALSLLIVWLLS